MKITDIFPIFFSFQNALKIAIQYRSYIQPVLVTIKTNEHCITAERVTETIHCRIRTSTICWFI
jgi:hypothetical protein